MKNRLPDGSIRELRQIVRAFGPDRVAEALDEVVNEGRRPQLPSERRAACYRERGLKGDGTDIIYANEAWLGDIVELAIDSGTTNRFSHSTVVNITNEGRIRVTLVRPYVHTEDYVTTAGLPHYLGQEVYTVEAGTKLRVIDGAYERAR